MSNNFQFKPMSPVPKRNYQRLYGHRANIYSFDEDNLPRKSRINQISNKTFERNELEDVLMGKKGVEALNLTDFTPMNFKDKSTMGSTISDKSSFWMNLFSYTNGRRDHANMNSVISKNLLK